MQLKTKEALPAGSSVITAIRILQTKSKKYFPLKSFRVFQIRELRLTRNGSHTLFLNLLLLHLTFSAHGLPSMQLFFLPACLTSVVACLTILWISVIP